MAHKRGAIIIDVTPEDIANGKAKSTSSCPIAQALSRTYGGEPYVSEQDLSLDFPDESKVFYGETTDVAEKFIEDFDHGKKVEPRRFRFIGWWETYEF